MDQTTEVPAKSDSFLDRLPELLKSHEIQSSFRLTKQGVFVDESAVPRLYEAYQQWLSKAAGEPETRTLEKCKKRFFGTEEPKLYYVLDGNRCLAGFLLRDEITDPKRIKLPVYQANLQDTLESLHHRDPFLSSLEKVKTRMTTHEGFVIELLCGARRFEVNEEGVREFAHVLRSSPRLLARFPDAKKALRYVLDPMRQVLEQAHALSPTHSLLVPERLKSKPELTMLRAHGMTFAVQQQKKICGCFRTAGKSLARFLRKEIQTLQALKTPEPPVRGLQLDSPKKHCIAKTWSEGISFHLQLRALILFLQQTERSPKLRKKLPPLFSVRDLLGRFVSLFRSSKPVDERAVLAIIGRRREALARYRRVGNWLFVIVDKNVIQSCLAVKGAAAGEEKEAPQAQGRPGGPKGDRSRRRRRRPRTNQSRSNPST
ncbi:MAG: hypothetical protein U0136_08450 [Bdellovibrionota bacterium]